MKNRFICQLFFEEIDGIWPFLIHTACQGLLGISPKFMSIYTDKEELQDIFFDENKLFSCLGDSPGTVLLKETYYDRSLDNFWFQIKKEDGKHLCVSWCNGNLNFLLDGNISQFLNYSSFTVGYCFRQREVKVISKTMQSFKDEPNFDWRTQLFVSGLAFMAAPIMWFGKSFFSIISKEKLLSYAKAVEISENLILIELFDLSEPITSDEKKQQRFWEFFKLYSVAKKYEEENDVTESLTDFFSNAFQKNNKTGFPT